MVLQSSYIDIFAKYLLLWSGRCTVKRKKGIFGGNSGNFFEHNDVLRKLASFPSRVVSFGIRQHCPRQTHGHRVYFGDRQSFGRSVSGTRRSRSRH